MPRARAAKTSAVERKSPDADGRMLKPIVNHITQQLEARVDLKQFAFLSSSNTRESDRRVSFEADLNRHVNGPIEKLVFMKSKQMFFDYHDDGNYDQHSIS